MPTTLTRCSAFQQPGLKKAATLSPHLNHVLLRLEARSQPAEVPFPLCGDDKRTHLLVLVSLEGAPRDALKSGLGKDGGSDPRTSFYNKFKEEVAEHDNDLQKKHDEDLNTTLIFVSFFPHT